MEKRIYNSIHDYVRKHKKHIKNCEICGEVKKLDCALISGKNHEKNQGNYMCLCKKCHYHYDHPNGLTHSDEVKKKIGLASSERIKKNGVNLNFVNATRGRTVSIDTKLKMSLAKKREVVHGTLTGYKHYKCKCELCTKANTEYCKKYNKRKNEK